MNKTRASEYVPAACLRSAIKELQEHRRQTEAYTRSLDNPPNPLGKDDCIYCGAELGAIHRAGCVAGWPEDLDVGMSPAPIATDCPICGSKPGEEHLRYCYPYMRANIEQEKAIFQFASPEGVILGKLFFKGGKWSFEGDTDESAKVFVKFVLAHLESAGHGRDGL